MSTTLGARLQSLADGLPAGGSVVLTKDGLLELAALAGESEGGGDLTVNQAAERLGCSPSHVRRLCESGRLAGYKLSGTGRAAWRVSPAALGKLRTDNRDAGDHQGPATDLSAWRRLKAGEESA